MHIKVDREQLIDSLSMAVRVASGRPTLQALSGVELTATDGRVELRATDSEVSVKTAIAATVDQPGKALLPARLIADIVKSLPAAEVEIDLGSDDITELKSGSATFKLRALRADDFPPLPSGSEDSSIELDLQEFIQTVNRVIRSASRDETRPILTGILMHANANNLRMVATDSYRLSVQETVLTKAVHSEFEANIPARALQEIVRTAGTEPEGTIKVSIVGHQVVFVMGEVTLSSRMIDGQYPNYKQLIPDSFSFEAEADRAQLLDVVRRISLLAQRSTPIKFSLKSGEITVSASTPDIGEAYESLPVNYQGDELEIGFNSEFLRSGLETIESDLIKLRFISALRPGLLQPTDSDDFTYLVMPIRLSN